MWLRTALVMGLLGGPRPDWNHCARAARSYVCPSAATTGSCITSCVMGQRKASGTGGAPSRHTMSCDTLLGAVADRGGSGSGCRGRVKGISMRAWTCSPVISPRWEESGAYGGLQGSTVSNESSSRGLRRRSTVRRSSRSSWSHRPSREDVSSPSAFPTATLSTVEEAALVAAPRHRVGRGRSWARRGWRESVVPRTGGRGRCRGRRPSRVLPVLAERDW